MNEELTNEDIEQDEGVVLDDNIQTIDSSQDIEVEETVEFVEVEPAEETVIEMDEAIGWVGGDSTRHYSLYGRDEPDQHPITAITGLREELDDIEALDVVFSDEKNQADYYLWEDENPTQENRTGLFVTLCNDTDRIKMCTETDDIFGVTTDVAAFIGGQNDVVRGYEYGLVVYSGIAAVRCELLVEVGDYVIPNNYGYAKKSDTGYGYRVFALESIKGVSYAVISLGIPANIIHTMSHNIEDLGERMDDAETNIAAAINRANAAYNKAGEVGELSEEAVKQVLEALKKAEDALEDVEQMEENVSSANQLAAQARAIAESAATSAVSIRDEAVATANEALSNVNDLIEDLEPINKWECTDPNTGEKFTGASYFVQHVENDLVTRTEIESAGGLTTDALSAISQNAKNIEMLVSSIDKYSVGEYSQAYGLTREQAKSILKPGYIYIPTKHEDSDSHTETFIDETEINEFTPGNYYVWEINDQGNADWIEHSIGSVWISSEPPANSNGTYKYWYLDSNEPAEGYEAYALYIWEKEQWVKVNILDGNVNNRLTSMIRQTADGVALEVVNARGSAATLGTRITNTESEVQSIASWTKDPDGNQYNLATIKQTADDAGASVALVVTKQNGNNVVDAASIVTAINGQTGDSIIKLNANVVDITAGNIDLTGVVTVNDYIKMDTDGKLIAKEAIIDGTITAESGKIAGFTIEKNDLKQYLTSGLKISPSDTNNGVYIGTDGIGCGAGTFYVDTTGKLTATKGKIGAWAIAEKGDDLIGTGGIGVYLMPNGDGDCFEGDIYNLGCTGNLAIRVGDYNNATFGVTGNGTLFASNAYIAGKISSTEGNIGDWQITDHGIWYATNSYLISLGDANVEDSGTFKGIHLYIGNSHFVVDTSDNTLSMRIYNTNSLTRLTIDDDGGRLEGFWTLNGETITTS